MQPKPATGCFSRNQAKSGQCNRNGFVSLNSDFFRPIGSQISPPYVHAGQLAGEASGKGCICTRDLLPDASPLPEIIWQDGKRLVSYNAPLGRGVHRRYYATVSHISRQWKVGLCHNLRLYSMIRQDDLARQHILFDDLTHPVRFIEQWKAWAAANMNVLIACTF